ncbi:hypothetical protein EBZ37_02810 [bacterium]|nr:hypothetical protein [bacterium]
MANLTSFSASFGFGVSLLFRAAKLVLTKPKLFFSCLIPWLLAGALSWYWIRAASEVSVSALSWITTFLGIALTGLIASLMHAVISVLSWITGALLLTWSAAILTIPLADWISEITESVSRFRTLSPEFDSSWFSRAQWRRIKIDFRKTIASLLMGFLGLLLAHIPIVGVLGPVILSFGLSFQFLSYPQTRREQGVRKSLGFLIRYPGACLGFGGSLLVLFSVPFLSALVFPLAVVGGTLLDGHAQGRITE